MLFLTRKLNEVITLGNSLLSEMAIEVEVLKVSGDQIRLRVKAPHGILVHASGMRMSEFMTRIEEQRNPTNVALRFTQRS